MWVCLTRKRVYIPGPVYPGADNDKKQVEANLTYSIPTIVRFIEYKNDTRITQRKKKEMFIKKSPSGSQRTSLHDVTKIYNSYPKNPNTDDIKL